MCRSHAGGDALSRAQLGPRRAAAAAAAETTTGGGTESGAAARPIDEALLLLEFAAKQSASWATHTVPNSALPFEC